MTIQSSATLVSSKLGQVLLAFLLMAQFLSSFGAEPLADEIVTHIKAAKEAYAAADKLKARLHLGKLFDLIEKEATSFASSNERLQLIEFQRKLGRFCEDQGDPEEAIAMLRRSMVYVEESFGRDHLETATGLALLAVTLGRKGDYSEAIPFLERCLKIRQAKLSPDHPDSWITVGNLAFCFVETGDFAKALPLRKSIVTMREMLSSPASPEMLNALEGLGIVHHLMGNFSLARTTFRQVISVRERTVGGTLEALTAQVSNGKTPSQEIEGIRERVAALIGNWGRLALICQDIGDYREAQILGRQSRIWGEQIFGSHHAVTIEAATIESRLCLAQERFADALPLLETNLLRLGAASETNFVQVTTVLNNLGLALKGVGRDRDALTKLQQAFAINEKFLGKEHVALTTPLLNLAALYRDLGNYSAALPLHERSLALADKYYGRIHPVTTLAAAHLAIWHIKQGVFPEELFQRGGALDASRKYIPSQLPLMTDAEADQLLQKFLFLAEGLHSICALPLKSVSGGYVWRGAEGLALGKAMIEEASSVRAVLDNNPSTSTRPILQKLEELRRKMWQTEEMHRSETVAEISRLESTLIESGGLVAETLLARKLTMTDIARTIPSNSVLVDFVRYKRWDYDVSANNWREARYAAYLTSPLRNDSTNLVVERVDLGEAAPIDEAVETLSKRFSANPAQYRAKDALTALERLSELVYGPLSRHLTNTAHLILCPDGQLSRVPFEMLAHAGRYLIEDKRISYVSSGRELVRLAQPKSITATNASLVMGSPDFNLALPGVGYPAAAASSAGATNDLLVAQQAPATRSRDTRGLNFSPLPATEREARASAKLLSDDCVLRLGADARESVLKQAVSPRILHLATHGFFLTDQEFRRTNGLPDLLKSGLGVQPRAAGPDWENPMIRCGIALAGANRASQITNAVAEDGILTGLEASLLNLQGTELVILSACQTAAGDVRIGEGVMSLRRAFTIAGAESVLASHWPVSDEATQRLMTEFLRHWRSGKSRADALRHAQLSLLRSKDLSSPYFWAAFTLTGQWR